MEWGACMLLSCVVVWIAVNVPYVECDLAATVTSLARQLMNQELAAHEKIRSEGDSGLKLIRLRNKGTKSYHSETFSGQSIAGMHDHSNNIRTVGMGEVMAVLNGVEFRTRHNDFRLRMPSKTSGDWNAVVDIPYPGVPGAVQGSPEEQIAEMQEWFKAWQMQDTTTQRDYTNYFKPVLCYLEGAWTKDITNLEEPFFSDRHEIEAKNWFDLLEKIRFTSYTGKKNNFENLAYLPTTLMNLIDGTDPEFAQWNFRILCHPLKDDLPLDRLQLVDDLATRMRYGHPIAEHLYSRGARFQLPEEDATFQHSAYKTGLLDKLMGEIPGKDNYGGDIVDSSLGEDAVDEDRNMLNVAYYHRVLHYRKKGAMGENVVHRGFSDQNLFVAYTTQPKVSEMRVETCRTIKWSGLETCQEDSARLSYAIPLEIIYLTPLYNWNPYNIVYRGDKSDETEQLVNGGEGGARNGDLTIDAAFDGTHSTKYYRTPKEFFTGNTGPSDTADTSKNSIGVLDRDGQLREVTGSGTRIILPHIDGVGRVRTRYSIAPIYEDGSNIKKELDALKDLVLDLQQNQYMIRDPPASFQYSAEANADTDTMIITGESQPNPYGIHTHTVRLTANDMENLMIEGRTIRKRTSLDNYHSHDVKIHKQGSKFRLDECDGYEQCWHVHSRWLTKITTE